MRTRCVTPGQDLPADSDSIHGTIAIVARAQVVILANATSS